MALTACPGSSKRGSTARQGSGTVSSTQPGSACIQRTDTATSSARGYRGKPMSGNHPGRRLLPESGRHPHARRSCRQVRRHRENPAGSGRADAGTVPSRPPPMSGRAERRRFHPAARVCRHGSAAGAATPDGDAGPAVDRWFKRHPRPVLPDPEQARLEFPDPGP